MRAFYPLFPFLSMFNELLRRKFHDLDLELNNYMYDKIYYILTISSKIFLNSFK